VATFSQSGAKTDWRRRLSVGFRWLAGHSRVLSVPFVLCIYGYLGFRLAQDWDTLGPTFSQARYGYLALASILLFVALGVTAGRWFVTLRLLGAKISWWESLRVWFLSQAGRYIPGSIWPYVGRMYWGAETVSSDKMVSSLALELLFRVSSETGLAALLLLIWALIAGRDGCWLAGAAAFAAAVVVGHIIVIYVGPRLYRRLTPVLQNKVPGWAFLGALQLSNERICIQWIYYTVCLGAVGVAFYVFVAAFYPLGIGALPALTGSLAAATVIGFLIPLAPNGWGIREGILAFLLARLMPTSVAVMISMTSRAWLALVEALWVVVILILSRKLHTAPVTFDVTVTRSLVQELRSKES
jgi:uncharacterized membrane protein YbhN (UPF0104 family)